MNENKKGLKGEATKAKILQAARQVMAQKGFTRATTSEIAKAAGVAEGTIFRYFKTKKDILLSLIPREIIETLALIIEGNSKVWDEEFLTQLIKNRLQLIKENLDVIKILVYESQFNPELKEYFLQNVILKLSGMMENYFQQKINQGEFKPVNPKIATRTLVGMVGVFVMWKEFLKADKHDSFTEDQVVGEIVDIFLNGIKK